MTEIPLNKGFIALIDDEDYELVKDYTWFVIETNNNYYAVTTIWLGKNGRQKTRRLKMHKLICPQILKIDHKDGNGLNNQKNNLRPATNQQNGANRKKTPNLSSQYKGVHWVKRNRKWSARIMADGKRYVLGYFSSEELAARAYDAKAIELFGEYANLNFP